MTPSILDVREDLRGGREPLPKIMKAVKGLEPGQALILRTTFEPIPLYRVLGLKGYGHEARRMDTGDWEIVFSPGGRRGLFGRTRAGDKKKVPAAAPEEAWPEPVRSLDNRGLTPPEPMIRILSNLEEMRPGEVLAAYNDREPQFLYPELEARGHSIRVEHLERGAHLLIRHGG